MSVPGEKSLEGSNESSSDSCLICTKEVLNKPLVQAVLRAIKPPQKERIMAVYGEVFKGELPEILCPACMIPILQVANNGVVDAVQE